MPPDKKPNQFARVAAVTALAIAFLVVIVSIGSSGGDSGGDDGGDDTEQTDTGAPTREGQRAIDEGVWIVGEGDSLTSISEETGIDLDVLLELNPDVDPQRLGDGPAHRTRPGAQRQRDRRGLELQPGFRGLRRGHHQRGRRHRRRHG